MDGLDFQEIKKSELENEFTIGAEYYGKKYVESISVVKRQKKTIPLGQMWILATVADGLFCREIDGLFCRSSPDIIVRRRCVLCVTAGIAVENGYTVDEFKKNIFPHPTVSEILHESLYI